MKWSLVWLAVSPCRGFAPVRPARPVVACLCATHEDFPPSEEAAFEEALWRMTNDQLRLHLKRRGMKTSGKKVDLVMRALKQPVVAKGPRRKAQIVDPGPPMSERKVLDGLLRDDIELERVVAYTSSTREAWRPPVGDRGKCGIVVAAPNVSDSGLRLLADSLAFVCNAIAIATQQPQGIAPCLRWLREERRADSLGLIALGAAADDLDAGAGWDAIVLWRPTSQSTLLAATQPVLVIVDAAASRAALDADVALKTNRKCKDYLVRALAGLGPTPAADFPRDDDDEALLLCTAWFDLHLGRREGARTAGPPASQLWMDDPPQAQR